MVKAEPPLWNLTRHCCRSCFAVIVERPKYGSKHNLYRCTNCGTEREGTTPHVLCACGSRLKTGRLANLRCVPNPAPTPECPALFIVEEGPAP